MLCSYSIASGLKCGFSSKKTAQTLNYECEEIIIWCPGRFVERATCSAVHLASQFSSCLLPLHCHFAGKRLSPLLTISSSNFWACTPEGIRCLSGRIQSRAAIAWRTQKPQRPFSAGCWHLKFFTPQLLLHKVKISHRSVHNTHEKLLKIANMLCGDIHHLLICLREDSQQHVWLHLFGSFTFGKSVLRR